MIKNIITIILLIICVNASAQNSINTIFKTLLILDRSIGLKSNDSINNTLIKEINENVILNVKELKSIDSPSFFLNFKIYSVDLEKQIFLSNEIPLVLNKNVCTNYIIAFNSERQVFYRLKGFKNNDFNSLIRDIVIHSDKIKSKEVVNELAKSNFEGIDFQCLYKAMNDLPNSHWKYPCLQICTNFVPSHISK